MEDSKVYKQFLYPDRGNYILTRVEGTDCYLDADFTIHDGRNTIDLLQEMIGVYDIDEHIDAMEIIQAAVEEMLEALKMQKEKFAAKE